MPNVFSDSALAVWKHTISVIGSPQNSADNPRTSRPSDRNSSALGAGSGMFQIDRTRQLETQISIFFQPALVIVQQAHGFGGLHAIGFDGLVNLRLHLALELVLVVLDRCQALDDRAALDDLLDIIARWFIGFEEDMHLVDAPEEVMQVPHNILISAHQEEADVVRL